jgi:hypothetical protein
VAQRLALGRDHQRREGLALEAQALLEVGRLGGLLDAVGRSARAPEKFFATACTVLRAN